MLLSTIKWKNKHYWLTRMRRNGSVAFPDKSTVLISLHAGFQETTCLPPLLQRLSTPYTDGKYFSCHATYHLSTKFSCSSWHPTGCGCEERVLTAGMLSLLFLSRLIEKECLICYFYLHSFILNKLFWPTNMKGIPIKKNPIFDPRRKVRGPRYLRFE